MVKFIPVNPSVKKVYDSLSSFADVVIMCYNNQGFTLPMKFIENTQNFIAAL